MAYTTRKKIEALIPANFLERGIMIEGQEQNGLLDNIIDIADREIDGFLSARYTVPFAVPVTPFIETCSIVISCDLIYRRNSVPDDQNPWSERSEKIRNQLQDLSDGVKGLEATGGSAGMMAPTELIFNKA